MILKGKRFAVGPVFFTIAMVLYVCSVYSWLCLRAGARPPGSSSRAPGASLVVPEARGGWLYGCPSAWPRRLEPPNPRGRARPIGD